MQELTQTASVGKFHLGSLETREGTPRYASWCQGGTTCTQHTSNITVVLTCTITVRIHTCNTWKTFKFWATILLQESPWSMDTHKHTHTHKHTVHGWGSIYRKMLYFWSRVTVGSWIRSERTESDTPSEGKWHHALISKNNHVCPNKLIILLWPTGFWQYYHFWCC